jgi:hypothetical protein
MFEFLENWWDIIGDVFRMSESAFWGTKDFLFDLAGDPKGALNRLKEATLQVTLGKSIDAALVSVGLSAAQISEMAPVVKKLRETARVLDISLHVFAFLVGTGVEYYLDRRKNFSFTKASMYYAALYAFTSATLHQQAIIGSLSVAENALETLS